MATAKPKTKRMMFGGVAKGAMNSVKKAAPMPVKKATPMPVKKAAPVVGFPGGPGGKTTYSNDRPVAGKMLKPAPTAGAVGTTSFKPGAKASFDSINAQKSKPAPKFGPESGYVQQLKQMSPNARQAKMASDAVKNAAARQASMQGRTAAPTRTTGTLGSQPIPARGISRGDLLGTAGVARSMMKKGGVIKKATKK